MRSTAVHLVFALLVTSSSSENATAGPGPLVIPPSQYFEGNDGPWSTFDLRVGTPEQYIRVLISTASPYSMIPLSDQGCSTSVFATVPPDCAVSRGNLFNPNDSSTWKDIGLYGINQNGVGLEANLGYEQRVQFGEDHLGIGLTGPGFDNQIVGGIATPEPFYLGIFGLNNQPMNFSVLGNDSSPSFITTLKDQNKIPSLSWSYTAGAKYRLKQVYGQLIFSGYDTSRFQETPVSFTMADDVTRDLVVALQSISYSGSTSTTLLSNPIDIYIDSTDPNLWLPAEACDAFEKAFGLTLDSQTGLYLVNETHRNRLLDSNAQVSFRLSDVKSGGDTVTIVLPYAAFDLTAENPLVENTSHYFPLKRANSSSQYTLGRTFLQEAYLSADYERRVFNVSACVWNEGAQENIVTIPSKDDPSAGTGGGPSDTSSSNSSGLSGGAIAGIVISVVLGILLAVAATIVLLRKRRKWLAAGFADAAAARNHDSLQPDESVLKGPVFNSPSFRHGSNSTTQDGSVPYSADDISGGRGSRSTAEYNRRPGSGTAHSESPAAEAGAGGASTPELDGRDTIVRPTTELDGNEIQKPLPPVIESPLGGVYELPATPAAVDDSARRREMGLNSHRPPSTVASSVSRDEGEGGSSGPGLRDSVADSALVSPDTPVHRRSGRPF